MLCCSESNAIYFYSPRTDVWFMEEVLFIDDYVSSSPFWIGTLFCFMLQDVLYTVCNPIGNVLRIVIFKRNGIQAMVEYPYWKKKATQEDL